MSPLPPYSMTSGRTARSCETQLLLTFTDLVHAYDRRKQCDAGILDFIRAFDTVPHYKLLSKCAHHYGIKGPVLHWILNFLTNRNMWVAIEGEASLPTRVLSGIPQGTALGPLLFLVYINDLPQVTSEGTTGRLFADDCLVYREIYSQQDHAILQRDLHALEQWAKTWGMRFNPKKCVIMRIGRSSNAPWLYDMCGEVLQTTPSAKYLGVTISSDLKWETHINNLSKKANSTLHVIPRNLRYCPKSARHISYFTLVQTSLEYYAPIWDPCSKDTNKLEMVNRRAARIVKGHCLRDREVSVTALLEELK